MQIRFLFGPAGSGKTYRCLSEARQELLQAPDGDPLIFLSPKQATFQLERQLLSEPGLQGYTRLHILSFDRLARFIFDQCKKPLPELLSEDGRVMVLRAILAAHDGSLSVFRTSARREGFPQELSRQIREFQNQRLDPADLRKLARDPSNSGKLCDKLNDLARVYEAYLDWLNARDLKDGDALLTLAADLAELPSSKISICQLWLDGFAQFTPQERRLLTAICARTAQATLAFCLENEQSPHSPLSHSFLPSKTVRECAGDLEARFGKAALTTEILKRETATSRFANSPALAYLESSWDKLRPTAELKPAQVSTSIQIAECGEPESEAIFAAREIIGHVRAGGRFRDIAVLLRSFENEYPRTLRRVFQRYSIPFFLDQRESVSHHPLAELTRGALRTVAFDWKTPDWFATLKSGLVPIAPDLLHELENEALARGWEGPAWRKGFRITDDPARENEVNKIREFLVEPFATFSRDLAGSATGPVLADALGRLWQNLQVESQLQKWSERDPSQALHTTVWEQMDRWLADIRTAFNEHSMPLREWLPIVEAGLANLTIGVIPPALDQVLIGTIDRSRNPDLALLFLLGMNEGAFPAAPTKHRLLTESDREALDIVGCRIGGSASLHLAQEQYYGYIACTRARQKFHLSYSRTRADGKAANPSRFVDHLKFLFPNLASQPWEPPTSLEHAEHPCELRPHEWKQLPESNHLAAPLLEELPTPSTAESLSPALARALYTDTLKISVSSLERFAMCPYRFFLEKGLRLQEREKFTLDVREQGSFQHEVLAAFHIELKTEGKRWRDITVPEARQRIARIADEKIDQFGEGLLTANEVNRFQALSYKAALQDFIAVIIDWFETNHFDPEMVEFAFGFDNIPGWKIPLPNGCALLFRGRIDRIDLHRDKNGHAYCVVMDYKSGQKKPDEVLAHHGIQQQLLAYLLACTQIDGIKHQLGVTNLTPAGAFFAPLRPKYESNKTRTQASKKSETSRELAYKHFGLFDFKTLGLLDAKGDSSRAQFSYILNKKDGKPRKGFALLETPGFKAVLAQSETLLRQLGTRIYDGDISIHPFKKSSTTACDTCDYHPICRFDPWVQPFNNLSLPKDPSK